MTSETVMQLSLLLASGRVWQAYTGSRSAVLARLSRACGMPLAITRKLSLGIGGLVNKARAWASGWESAAASGMTASASACSAVKQYLPAACAERLPRLPDTLAACPYRQVTAVALRATVVQLGAR